jgi:hypothetical protein
MPTPFIVEEQEQHDLDQDHNTSSNTFEMSCTDDQGHQHSQDTSQLSQPPGNLPSVVECRASGKCCTQACFLREEQQARELQVNSGNGITCAQCEKSRQLTYTLLPETSRVVRSAEVGDGQGNCFPQATARVGNVDKRRYLCFNLLHNTDFFCVHRFVNAHARPHCLFHHGFRCEAVRTDRSLGEHQVRSSASIAATSACVCHGSTCPVSVGRPNDDNPAVLALASVCCRPRRAERAG